MAFLTWLGRLILNLLIEKIWGAISAGIKLALRRKQIDDAAKASVEPLKNAQTGKEIDDATDDALNHF